MDRDFLNRFWALVRLRYKLLWANARTGNGKLAVLFAVYLIGGLFTLFFALGGLGLGAVLGTTEPVKAQYFARWILTGLFINGVGLSLLFGMGPRAAFSEEVLRRYPLDARERFFVRQVIGILDPVWLLLIAAAYGLAAGIILQGGGSIIRTLPAVTIFIVTSYLATIVLLTLIAIVMETRKGSGLLSMAVLMLVSFGPLALTLLVKSQTAAVWKTLDQILYYLPPGAAAMMIVGDTVVKALGGLVLLLFWCTALLWALEKLETRPVTTQVATPDSIMWQDFYDQLSGLFGSRYAPLISKSLRYHMRCNMIRFSLVTAPVIVMAGKYVFPRQGLQSEFIISMAIFFIMSSATAAAMMLDAFGFDDAGIRRYAIWPMHFVEALRAINLASLLLRGVAVLGSFALWLLFYSSNLPAWRVLVMTFCTALASLFLYNAAGFWTSVFSPKRMDFEAMWGNRLSFGANVVIIVGVLAPFDSNDLEGQRLL
ncbi:MAG: hypothetical protein ABI977_09420, partial [Acidobacteriota bacterium]